VGRVAEQQSFDALRTALTSALVLRDESVYGTLPAGDQCAPRPTRRSWRCRPSRNSWTADDAGAFQTRVVAFESRKLTQPERSYPPGPRT
jgi:hypothetical protein